MREEFLEQLRRVPIVQVACEKSGISRNSIYRWRHEDAEFRQAMDQAMQDGVEIINDMSESQLLMLIREKNWPSIRYWLDRRNPKFREHAEIVTPAADEPLTPQQAAIVRRALELTAPNDQNYVPDTDH